VTEVPDGDPGVLIGHGRAADVYALDERRVMRRCRVPSDLDTEGALMSYLEARGYPVPHVYDVDGSSMVMERLYGPTMMYDLLRRPHRAQRHARTLADLHERLHAIPAPGGLRRLYGSADRTLHLDLHPGNVMLTGRGPVVIDWTNAGAGDPGADVALTMVTALTSDISAFPGRQRAVLLLLRRGFVRRFAAAAGADPTPYLALVAADRLADPNVLPAEATRLRRLAGEFATGPADPPQRPTDGAG
jgi:aminoglycoside phosphotransferase (APT) family kinase protein